MAKDRTARSRGGFRVAAGVLDFFGVALCTVLILGLLFIMSSLFSWLRTDLTETFSGITENLTEAVVVEGNTNTQE